ncbi:ESX-5 secretion system protein EccD5 [Mycobacterium simulans]|uniref:type VII secretion integral membrane protein EccD n=1 Tax=Mycobacterium simulans TaxID=627089 RepID=UPI00174DA64A|nr:type VII secretion integral membrane protein EccD [Mycobacterium simulans]SON58748.1 ESX-5 secretion system protein EccD5 [Mycobacterium simulans]
MSASDPGLRRVAVHAGTATVDLSLPAAVPVATLIPSIIDMVGTRTADSAAMRYQLSRVGASALPGSTTLAQNDIRDGTVLVLSQSPLEPPVTRCDDVAESVSATLDSSTGPRSRKATRLTGAVAAICLTATGALVLARNALNSTAARHAGTTAAMAAGAAAIALLCAAIAHRTYRDPGAGLSLGLIAIMFAAVAGLLAVPGVPGAASVLLAAMAAAVTAVLAMRVTGCGVVTLTAVACSAVVTAIAALAGVLVAAPPCTIGSALALASLGLLELSPRIAIQLAGLSPRDDDLPAADLVAAKAIRADVWLTSLLAAFASSAAIGAIAAAISARKAVPLAAVIAALLLLRARSVVWKRTLVFVISGITTATTTFAVAAAGAPRHGPWIAALAATLAAVAMYLGFMAPTTPLSPVARRSVQVLECLMLVTMVPLTCWICGVFSAVRGVDLI